MKNLRFLYFTLFFSTSSLLAQELAWRVISPSPNSSMHRSETSIILQPIGLHLPTDTPRLLIQQNGRTLKVICTYSESAAIWNLKSVDGWNGDDEVLVQTLEQKDKLVYKNQILQNFTFSISKNYKPSTSKEVENLDPHFKTINPEDLPDNFPDFEWTVEDDSYDGLMFFNIRQQDQFLVVANQQGEIQYYKDFDGGGTNFEYHPNGSLAYFKNGDGVYYKMDTSFQVIDTLSCVDGYATDGHDMRMMENGHVMLMSYDEQEVDMSQIVPNGNPAALVKGLVLQELDADGVLVFQWRSWDHFEITDDVRSDLTEETVSYVHGNSLEVLPDGNWLLSSRNMNEVTKINRETGDITWRMSGENNQFDFINDPHNGFVAQHDARWTSNGTMTIYDNGFFRDEPEARASEYIIDEENMTAELIWSYAYEPSIPSRAMGSHQLLPNGNHLICWGLSLPSDDPLVTEVTSEGEIVLNLELQDNNAFYRARKYPAEILPLCVTTSTNQLLPSSLEVSFYPNPSFGFLTWESEKAFPVEQIMLWDLQGKLVWSEKFSPQGKGNLNLQKILQGNYILEFKGAYLNCQEFIQIIR